MNDIIKLCNENSGFISALLTIGTIFVSIIAVYISIRTENRERNMEIFNLDREMFRSLRNILKSTIKLKQCYEEILEIAGNDMPDAKMKCEEIDAISIPALKTIYNNLDGFLDSFEYLYAETVNQSVAEIRDSIFLLGKHIKVFQNIVNEEDIDKNTHNTVEILNNILEVSKKITEIGATLQEMLRNKITRRLRNFI